MAANATARTHAMTRNSIKLEDRLIVALDVPTVENAKRLVATLGSAVGFYKIGLQLQFAGGVELARELVQQGKKVFLDAKLHDIDQTVQNAVENIVKLGVTFLTVHGNTPTVKAAIAGRGSDKALKIFAVTALTSLDARDLADMGVGWSVEEYVLRRADQVLAAGADGVIASGHEAGKIRARAGEQLLIITPGIRSEGVAVDDQKRVTTPAQAIAAGSDYLVMGREILRAPNPAQKAEEVLRQIETALKG
jgi:orotidine-5'-phosphate decarboxylase